MESSKRTLKHNDEDTSSSTSSLRPNAKQPRLEEANVSQDNDKIHNNNNDTNLNSIQTTTASSSTTTTTTTTTTNGNDVEIIDVAESVGLKTDSRIEVLWDLTFDGNEQDENNNNNKSHDDGGGSNNCTPSAETRWWGGKIQDYDGRTYNIDDNENDHVIVPIRSIDYDPYPPSFPDRSIEDVCFLSNHSILNLSSMSRSFWRMEGDTWEPTSNDDGEDEEDNILVGSLPNIDHDTNGDIDDEISVTSTSQEDALREVLDTILKSALEKSGVMQKMNSLDRSSQSVVASKIAATKERLVTKLLEKLNSDDQNNVAKNGVDKVITPDLIKTVMAELGDELQN